MFWKLNIGIVDIFIHSTWHQEVQEFRTRILSLVLVKKIIFYDITHSKLMLDLKERWNFQILQ